jgi:iron(III) transport system substrate-binding protein
MPTAGDRTEGTTDKSKNWEDDMRTILGAVALLASATCTLISASAQNSSATPDFQKVVDAAKAEGRLDIWIATPTLPRTQAALFDAFNKRFGLSIKYEWLPMHPTRSLPRLVTEGKEGRAPADVAGSFTYDDLLVLKNANLLKPYPWVEVFGKELPTIKEPSDRLIPETRGLGLTFFDQVFLLAWNKDQIKEADLPSKLTDLTEPKWKGRFVTNAVFGLPLDTISIVLGRDGTLALARKLLDNSPLLKNGSPAVSQAVTSGEAPIGISTYLESSTAAKHGEPQGYRLLDDYVPVMPLHVVVPEGAPHPNAARLFAAWLATEGVGIIGEMEATGRVTDPHSELAQMVEKRAPTAQVVIAKNADQVQDILNIRRELNLMFTGR